MRQLLDCAQRLMCVVGFSTLLELGLLEHTTD